MIHSLQQCTTYNLHPILKKDLVTMSTERIYLIILRANKQIKRFFYLFFSVHYRCFYIYLITQKELFYMKLIHLSIAFLLLTISHKNFCMDLALRTSPTQTNFAIARAAQDAYRPRPINAAQIFQEDHEDEIDYDPSCKDFFIYGYNGFMIGRQIAKVLLPNDPIITTLTGFAVCATSMYTAEKIKKANATKQKID